MDSQARVKRIDEVSRRISKATAATIFGWGVLFAFVTSFRGPQYYANWGYEYCLFSFGSALQYYMAGQAALICFLIARHNRMRGVGKGRHPWLWLAMVPGFAYAAGDEMLVWHEKWLLAAAKHFPWMKHMFFAGIEPDSLLVLSLAIFGLVFTIFFFREIATVRSAARFYVLGLFLLMLAGAIDFLPKPVLQQRLPLGTEELGEYFSGASFAVAFLLYAVEQARLGLVNWLRSADRAAEMLDPQMGEVVSRE